MICWDILVAGSGPSASVASNLLSKAGMKVLVVDRAGDHDFKVGEVLPGAACRILRSTGIPTPETSGLHSKIYGTMSSWETPDLITNDIGISLDGPSWRLDRARFNSELRLASKGSGTIFHEAFVRCAHRHNRDWLLTLDDGSLVQARWVVDATGRRAALARTFGAKRVRDTSLIAVYARSETETPQPMSQRTVIEAAQEGWWYAAYLPSGRALAGIHVSPRNAARLRARDQWLRALGRTRHISRLFPEMSSPVLLAPMDAGGARTQPLLGDGWLACGDAAFSFEPLSSQGILTALYSGKLAAEFILKRTKGVSDASYGNELIAVWESYRTRLRAYYDACAFRWN